MKILLLSFHFPPDAPMPATRAPKLAKFLIEQGHDVRVICAKDPQPVVVHPLEIPEENVIRTDWRDVRTAPDRMLARFARTAPQTGDSPALAPKINAPAPPAKPGLKRRTRAFLRRNYDTVFCWPDGKIGWKRFATQAADDLLKVWRPDVIYATCPPHSTAIIAHAIAERAGIPWVAEFRDRWGSDAYSDHPAWRRRMEARQEQRILSTASGIVTVSPVWAEGYKARYGKDRVRLIYNGFDPEDYPLERAAESPIPDKLFLLYAGAIYPDRRDPRPVIEAIAKLGADAGRVCLRMYGKHLESATEAAAALNVSGSVEILPPVPHKEIIGLQYAADALVLLQWNDPRDAGTLPGKLFEYMAARRPILATGWKEGAGARIIRERGLGLTSNNPDEIAAWLRTSLNEKAAGRLPSHAPETRSGFSRPEQFAALNDFLTQFAPQHAYQEAAE